MSDARDWESVPRRGPEKVQALVTEDDIIETDM